MADPHVARIPADTLKQLVRHIIDTKVHKHDINVGLQAQVDIVGVSDWEHGFEGSLRRAITYRMYAFHDDGIAPDVDFAFHFSLRFEWASEADALFDGPDRTLVAELVDDTIVLDSPASTAPTSWRSSARSR